MTREEIKQDDYEIAKTFPYLSGLDFSIKGFYQKLPDKRNYFKVNAKNLSTKLLIEHFRGERTIALPKFPTTKIMIIDIDQRSQRKHISTQNIVKKLVEYLGEPF